MRSIRVLPRRCGPVSGVAVLMLALAGCGGSAAPNAAARSMSPSSAVPNSAGSGLIAQTDIEQGGATRLTVAGGMDWIVAAGGSAWTSNESLTQLDGRTDAVVSTIPLDGSTCLAPDVGHGSLWVGVCGTPRLLRIEPATGKVEASISIRASDLLEESSVAAGAGGVWILTSAQQLVEVDPETNKVVRIAPSPAGASAIRATDGALWATDHNASTLLRLDPGSLATRATIPVGLGPQFLAVGDGAIWTLNQSDGTVTRVDPATNRAVATVKVDSGSVDGGDIAVGGGFVWARVTDGLITKIDPRTNTVVARYGPGQGSGSVAADADGAWITAHDVNSVYRLPLP